MFELLTRFLPGRKPCDNNPGVFFDIKTHYSNEKLEKQKEYVAAYKSKFEKILSGNQLGWLESLYMCPPGFPEVEVLEVQSSCSIDWSQDNEDSTQGARIDFHLPPRSEFSGEIDAGCLNLTVKHQDGILTIESEYFDNVISLKTKQGYFSLTFFSTPFSRVAWLSGAKNQVVLRDWHEPWPVKELMIHINKGTLGIAGSQKWSSTTAVYDFPPESPAGKRYQVHSAPYWVREWEERARKLWHISIALRVCSDCLVVDGSIAGKKLPEYITELAKLILSSIHNFSHWRPSSAMTPTDGPWERGNWANGFLLGAFGLMVGLLQDHKLLHINEGSLIRSGNEKGVSWLLRSPRKKHRKLNFPPVAHWLRRSTNHGIVILASALVGYEELIRSLPMPPAKKKRALLSEDFWELMNGTFPAGVYPEGVRYEQFSLQEAIAYILYAYRSSGIHWRTFYLQNFGELPAIKACIEAAIYPGSNTPMVSWGDCPILPWKRSVLFFLDSIDSDVCPSISEQVVNNGQQVDLLKDKNDEILKTEPLTLPTLLLPEGSGVPPNTGLSARAFGSALASVKAREFSEREDWRLYVTTTPLHLTHNLDHDCASFSWAASGSLLIGEVSGRAAYKHSSVGIKDEMLYEKDNPFTCYGGEENGSLIDRNYTGAVVANYVADSAAVITARATSGVLYRDGSPLITNYRRDFVVLGDSHPIMIIISRGNSNNVSPYLNFVFPGKESVILLEGETDTTCHFGDDLAVMRVLKLGHHDASHHLVQVDNHNNAMRFIQCFPASTSPFLSVAVCETGKTRCKVAINGPTKSALSLSITPTSGNKLEIIMPSLDADIMVSAG